MRTPCSAGSPTLDYGDLAESDLVIEAITEDLDQKLEMWKGGRWARDDAYLATNTSSLSVATQADATKRPERMIGLHFFNPRR